MCTYMFPNMAISSCQLNKVLLYKSKRVLIREMRRGQLRMTLLTITFHSTPQKAEKEEKQKNNKNKNNNSNKNTPQGYFFCLITGADSYTTEIPLEVIYRVCSMINGCILGS